MFAFYLLTIWFIYTLAESISLDLKLSGYYCKIYPLGVSYSNIALTLCRFLNLIIMIPIAIYFDTYDATRHSIDNSLIILSFPLGAILAQFVHLRFYKIIQEKLLNYVLKNRNKNKDKNENTNISLSKLIPDTKINKENKKLGLKFSVILNLMFFLAYIGIPLSIFLALKFPLYRVTIFQIITISSGCYTLINTIIVDPCLSKQYLSKSFPNTFKKITDARNFVIFFYIPFFVSFMIL